MVKSEKSLPDNRPDRRTALLKALASIDQALAHDATLFARKQLSDRDRATIEYARVLLIKARSRVEGKLRAG
jgi:hypothetical protein